MAQNFVKGVANPWYTYPRIDNYAVYPDPEGPFPKPDTNIGVPNGTTITALLPGTVTGADAGSSWGPCVTITLDTPINSLAIATAYLHLGSMLVTVGQKVQAGTPIAIAGPSNSGAEMGFALCNGPVYGVGQGFAHVGDPLLNPVPIITAAITSTLGTGAFSSSIGGGAGLFSTVSRNTSIILNTIPGFVGIVDAIDNAEQFQPFTLPPDPTSPDANTFILGGIENAFIKTATLPAQGIQASLVFLVSNTMAFCIRAFIVIIGAMILIALIRNAMNASGATDSIKGLVQAGAMVAAA